MKQDVHRHCLSGLYVITDTHLIGGNRLLPAVESAIRGGARLIQYRDKSEDHSRRLQEASALLKLCRSHHIPLIINDDIALAADTGSDGVHLGKDDGSAEEARAALGASAIIGLSCYDNPKLGHTPDISYAAFGRFFPSTTKPDAPTVSIETLAKAKRELSIPVIAIGGITSNNGQLLRDAGADMLAVVAGVLGEDDIQGAAAALSALYT